MSHEEELLAKPATARGTLTPDEGVERLRELLLGDEYNEALKSLRDETHVERVAQVVSEALQTRAERDESLSQALAPTIDAALAESIRTNPQRITNVIFPIIGPAIRKAVASTFAEFVQTLDSILSQAFSVRSWFWRIEARRAGIPYAQFVLFKSLHYRVEAAFLFHRETGLLLHDVTAAAATVGRDAELVTSMLTAINDFANDAFQRDDSEFIERVQVGDLTLQIYAGPMAVLAVAVRGTADMSLSERVQTTLETVHREYALELRDFDGNKERFLQTEALLRECLLSQRKSFAKPRKPWLGIIVVALLLAGLGWQSYRALQAERLKNRILDTLSATPGLVVLNHESDARELKINLLRHLGASDPNTIVSAIDNPYWQVALNTTSTLLEPEHWILPLIHHHFNLPASVTLTIIGDTLKIAGQALPGETERLSQSPWLQSIFKTIDISNLNTRTLNAAEREQHYAAQWHAVVDQLQGMRIQFADGAAALSPSALTLVQAVTQQITRLQSFATELGIAEIQVIVTGYADASGNQRLNAEVSAARAAAVTQALQQRGISPDILQSNAGGALASHAALGMVQRAVTFQVLPARMNDMQEPTNDQ